MKKILFKKVGILFVSLIFASRSTFAGPGPIAVDRNLQPEVGVSQAADRAGAPKPVPSGSIEAASPIAAPDASRSRGSLMGPPPVSISMVSKLHRRAEDTNDKNVFYSLEYNAELKGKQLVLYVYNGPRQYERRVVALDSKNLRYSDLVSVTVAENGKQVIVATSQSVYSIQLEAAVTPVHKVVTLDPKTQGAVQSLQIQGGNLAIYTTRKQTIIGERFWIHTTKLLDDSDEKWIQLMSSSNMKFMLGASYQTIQFKLVQSDGNSSSAVLTVVPMQARGGIDSYFLVRISGLDGMGIGFYSQAENAIKFSGVIGAHDLEDPSRTLTFINAVQELIVRPDEPSKAILQSLYRGMVQDSWGYIQDDYLGYKVNYSTRTMRLLARLLSPVFERWGRYFPTLTDASIRFDLSSLYAMFLCDSNLVNVDSQQMVRRVLSYFKDESFYRYFNFEKPYLAKVHDAFQKLAITLPENSSERSSIVKEWAEFFEFKVYYEKIYPRDIPYVFDQNELYMSMIHGMAHTDNDLLTVRSELQLSDDKRWEIFNKFGVFLWGEGVTEKESDLIYNYLSLYPLELVSHFGFIKECSGDECQSGAFATASKRVITYMKSIDVVSESTFHHEMWHIFTKNWEARYLPERMPLRQKLFELGTYDDRPGMNKYAYSNTNFRENLAEFGGRQLMADTEKYFNTWVQQAKSEGRFIGLRTFLAVMEILASARNRVSQNSLSMPIYANYKNAGEVIIRMDDHHNIVMVEWPSQGRQYIFTYTQDDLLIKTMTIKDILTGEMQVIENEEAILHTARLEGNLKTVEYRDKQGNVTSTDYLIGEKVMKTSYFDISGQLNRYETYRYQSGGLIEKRNYSIIGYVYGYFDANEPAPYVIRRTATEYFDTDTGVMVRRDIVIYDPDYKQAFYSGPLGGLAGEIAFDYRSVEWQTIQLRCYEDRGNYRVDYFYKNSGKKIASYYFDIFGVIIKREFFYLSGTKMVVIEQGNATKFDELTGTAVKKWSNVNLLWGSINGREFITGGMGIDSSWSGVPNKP